MPARSTPAPRGIPFHLPRLARRGLAPDRKVGGIALAVSLGARAYVANLIGAHHLRQAFTLGQRVKIGELEGTILELTAVSIVLDTVQGRVNVPAKIYNEAPIILLAERSDDA